MNKKYNKKIKKLKKRKKILILQNVFIYISEIFNLNEDNSEILHSTI